MDLVPLLTYGYRPRFGDSRDAGRTARCHSGVDASLEFLVDVRRNCLRSQMCKLQKHTFKLSEPFRSFSMATAAQKVPQGR